MLISKHFDPVLGIDIHILIIPPAGPVPIPHPHIALVFDVIDYVPILGATVKVGGLPRSTAGTAGKPIPHIPMGGPFAKPPMNENEILMGSATVLADGGPLSFTALPTLSCHDIGIIAPPRKKKPKKSFGMVLPTSVVISIPLGMPVMVGGPPTVDMMGLAMMGGFAVLGGAFKKLRKMQKKSKRMKKMSDAIHNRAKKAMDKLGVPPNARNKIHKGICTVTGHPVDVATGKMFTDHIDFSLPGPLPLVWERTWYSTSVYDGPLGHGWHHSYDVKLCEIDNAVGVRLADGRSIAFPALDINETCFDRQERMTLLRDEEGYALDTSDGKRYRFAPFQEQLDNQLLVSLSQKNSGAKIEFFYNEKGQLNQIIDSGGRLIRLTYTDDNRIHKIYLPEPESNVTRDHTNPTFFCAIEHHYREGMLVQVDDALQQPLHYVYDHKLLIKETFRSGLSFYFQYDSLDHNARCLRTWGDEGIYWRQLHYDLDNNITWVKNSLGHVTVYYHNGVLPHKVVDPLEHESFTEYNEYSQIVCETNELGYKTKYEFDEFGNLNKVIRPDATVTQFVFDTRQNLIKLTDQIGNSWFYEYNDLGRMVSKTNPLGQNIRYEYDDVMMRVVTDGGGNKFYFFYDQNLNLRKIAEGEVEQLHMEYDALGNLLSSGDNRGNYRHFYYDKINRIRQIIEPDGNTRYIRYDNGNNIISAKDEYHEVFFEYRGMGRLSSRTQNGITVKFKYDTEEQLSTVINQDACVYEFERNANNDIVSESGFDGLTRQYVRDSASRITRINRPDNRHSTYDYDLVDRVVKVSHSDGTYKKFGYRPDGELISAENDSAVVRWSLNSVSMLIKEQQGNFWVSSEYDSMGCRTRIQSSFGLDQHIERDHRGDVLKVSTGTNQFEAIFTRDNQGLEIQRSLPGGIESRWTRDKLGRPLRHEILHGRECIKSKSYLWGLNNRLLKIFNDSNVETVFQHDNMGSLLSARYEDNNFDLRMPDALGNLFKTQSKSDREYGPAGQLLKVKSKNGSTYYRYDLEGNLISKLEPADKLWRYEWNGSGMLAKVIRPDGKEVTFEYDALGRRIQKAFDGKITRWIWDGNNPLHEWVEYLAPHSQMITHQKSVAAQVQIEQKLYLLHSLQPQGPPVLEEGSFKTPITWLYEPDSVVPMAKLVGNNHYSIVADHLGTPSAIFDRQGVKVWSAEIDVWGKLRNLYGEKDFCPLRFPGQYEDGETGLYYNRFRYYDPDAGQYVSQDPIRLAGGMAVYAYAKDPLNSIDPFGLVDNSATQIYDNLPTKKLKKKTVSTDGTTQTISGYSPKKPGEFTHVDSQAVMDRSKEIGHDLRPGYALDQGIAGQYSACHAEKQSIVNNPHASVIEVSRVQCTDCQEFFIKEAQHQKRAITVIDPSHQRVFMPDGTVVTTCR